MRNADNPSVREDEQLCLVRTTEGVRVVRSEVIKLALVVGRTVILALPFVILTGWLFGQTRTAVILFIQVLATGMVVALIVGLLSMSHARKILISHSGIRRWGVTVPFDHIVSGMIDVNPSKQPSILRLCVEEASGRQWTAEVYGDCDTATLITEMSHRKVKIRSAERSRGGSAGR